MVQAERSVEEIAGELDQSVANTSQHLQHLLRVGMTRTRRDGNRIFYEIDDPHIAALQRLKLFLTGFDLSPVGALANGLGFVDVVVVTANSSSTH